jgi:hypothetical protein
MRTDESPTSPRPVTAGALSGPRPPSDPVVSSPNAETAVIERIPAPRPAAGSQPGSDAPTWPGAPAGAEPATGTQPAGAGPAGAEPATGTQPAGAGPAGAEPAGAEPATGTQPAGPDRVGPLRALSGAWRAARAAVGLYLLLRLVGVAVLALMAHRAGRTPWAPLFGYDAVWYLDLARHGYDTVMQTRPDGSYATINLMFFPLYPALVAAVDAVLPGGTGVAALVVGWAAGLAAAWGIYAVGALVRDRRTGIVLAALWALVPPAIVQSMAYTETLFTALAAWTLYALLRRHWVTAGLLCAVAGLARATAVALIAAVGLAALVAIVRRRDGWRPWVGALLAPLGFAGFAAWEGWVLHRPDGMFWVQRVAWKIWFDGGSYTLDTASKVLTQPQPLVMYVVTAVLGVAIVLLVLGVADRYPWPLLVYSAVALVVVLGGHNYYYGKARLLMPAFPLLLPIALGLAAARTRNRVAVLASLALASAWYGAYTCLTWHLSP